MITGVERAREDLFAAHLLATTGFGAQSLAVTARAALTAVAAALVELGRVPPPDPAGVAAAFVRHVVRERGLDPETGRLLRSLHNRAVLADETGVVPQEELPRAISDATAVVDVVDAWLTRSEIVTIARTVRPARPGPPPRRQRR